MDEGLVPVPGWLDGCYLIAVTVMEGASESQLYTTMNEYEGRTGSMKIGT